MTSTETVRIGYTEFELPEETSTGINRVPKMCAFYIADELYPELREDLPREDMDIKGAFVIYGNGGDVEMIWPGTACHSVIMWMDSDEKYHLLWYTEIENRMSTKRNILRECECDGNNLVETFITVTKEVGKTQWRK